MMDYLILDCETTGLGDDDEPIECAALRVSPAWEVTRVFYCRWAPWVPVSPEAATINGYAGSAWDGYGKAHAYDLRVLNEIAEGAKLAGSNPGFDVCMLRKLRERHGVAEPALGTHRMDDLGSLGTPLCRAAGSPRGGQAAVLEALARAGLPVPPMPAELARHGRGRTGPHTALGDAWAALHALRCLISPAETYWRGRLPA